MVILSTSLMQYDNILTPDVVHRLAKVARHCKLDYVELREICEMYIKAYKGTSSDLPAVKRKVVALLIVINYAYTHVNPPSIDLSTVDRVKLMEEEMRKLKERMKFLELIVEDLLKREAYRKAYSIEEQGDGQ